MTRHEFFDKRLVEMGLFDHDADYEGLIGQSVSELSLCFAEQGHSGVSAELTLQVFNLLMEEWHNQGDLELD